MLTQEQHEQFARWILYRGQAVTLAQARDLLDRALARSKAKREAASTAADVEASIGSGRAEPIDGVELVVAAEKILAARGQDANDEAAYAAALEEAATAEPQAEEIVYRPSGDALAEAADLVLKERGLEHDVDQAAYASALGEADRRLSFTSRGRS